MKKILALVFVLMTLFFLYRKAGDQLSDIPLPQLPGFVLDPQQQQKRMHCFVGSGNQLFVRVQEFPPNFTPKFPESPHEKQDLISEHLHLFTPDFIPNQRPIHTYGFSSNSSIGMEFQSKSQQYLITILGDYPFSKTEVFKNSLKTAYESL